MKIIRTIKNWINPVHNFNWAWNKMLKGKVVASTDILTMYCYKIEADVVWAKHEADNDFFVLRKSNYSILYNCKKWKVIGNK